MKVPDTITIDWRRAVGDDKLNVERFVIERGLA